MNTFAGALKQVLVVAVVAGIVVLGAALVKPSRASAQTGCSSRQCIGPNDCAFALDMQCVVGPFPCVTQLCHDQ